MNATVSPNKTRAWLLLPVIFVLALVWLIGVVIWWPTRMLSGLGNWIADWAAEMIEGLRA